LQLSLHSVGLPCEGLCSDIMSSYICTITVHSTVIIFADVGLSSFVTTQIVYIIVYYATGGSTDRYIHYNIH